VRLALRILVEALSLTLSVGIVVGVVSLFGEILLVTSPDNWIDAGDGRSVLGDRFIPAFAAGFLAGASWGLLFGVAWGLLRAVLKKR